MANKSSKCRAPANYANNAAGKCSNNKKEIKKTEYPRGFLVYLTNICRVVILYNGMI